MGIKPEKYYRCISGLQVKEFYKSNPKFSDQFIGVLIKNEKNNTIGIVVEASVTDNGLEYIVKK